MSLETIKVKFREYKSKSFTFLGNPGNYSINTPNKRFPFLGYRKYCPAALPILKHFSYSEVEIWSELTSNEQKEIKEHYKEEGGGFKLLNESAKNLKTMEKIWEILRKTSYLASYYRCLPYLLPDYKESIEINDKYIYIFRTINGQGNPTFFREFEVKKKKYHQVIMNKKLKDNGTLDYYYLVDTRKYKSEGTNDISLPKKSNSKEYDYLFILSDFQLSVKRIEVLRKEIKNNKCFRAKRIKLLNNMDDYNLSRREASKKVEKLVTEVKKNLDAKYKHIKKQLSFNKSLKDLSPFIPQNTPASFFCYEDIIYDAPDKNTHTIFLIDYFKLTKEIKKNFDAKLMRLETFLNAKDKKSGFLKSELMLLNTHIENIVKSSVEDSDELIEFKEKLKLKLKIKDGSYEYKTWRKEYQNALWNIKKDIELSGIYLASAVDTNEFNSLQFDYHYLKMKTNKSGKDENTIDKMINETGEIVLSLMQSKPGATYLSKLSRKAVKNIEALSNDQKKSNSFDYIDYIYNKFEKNPDWLTPIITNEFRKVITGYGAILSAYVSTLKKKDIQNIKNVVAFQKIKLNKIKVKGRGKTAKKKEIALEKAEPFGGNIYNKPGFSKQISVTDEAVEVKITQIKQKSIEVNKSKFKTEKAFNYFCFALELWNLNSAYNELGNLDNNSIFSAEYMNYIGAYYDTVTSLLGICKNISLKNTIVINITSSCFDYYVSSVKSLEALGDDDYDSAVFHTLSSYTSAASMANSLYMINCIKTAIKEGVAIGKLGGLPGIKIGFIIGFVFGVLTAVFSRLADYFADSDYEKWFHFCYWGKGYGKSKGVYFERDPNSQFSDNGKLVIQPSSTPSFSEVSFSSWNKYPDGLGYQIQAFYNLFYSPGLKLIDSKGELSKIGITITPAYMTNQSSLKISACIKKGSDDKILYDFCSRSPLTLKYLPDKDKRNNCNMDITITEKKNSFKVNKIEVLWSSNNFPPYAIYVKELKQKLEKVKENKPILEIALEIDMYGDGRAIVINKTSFELKSLYLYNPSENHSFPGGSLLLPAGYKK